MGSIQDETECPQCGYERAMLDLYYKSNEEYIFCGRCGYYYSRLIDNHPKDNNYENWEPHYKTTIEEGFGCYSLWGKNGAGQSGQIKKGEEKKFREWAEKIVKDSKDALESFTVSYEKDNEFVTEDLFTGKIKPFKEEPY